MTERTLNSSPLRAAIGPFYAQKGQKIGACGGLTVSVSGLNAFLELMKDRQLRHDVFRIKDHVILADRP